MEEKKKQSSSLSISIPRISLNHLNVSISLVKLSYFLKYSIHTVYAVIIKYIELDKSKHKVSDE